MVEADEPAKARRKKRYVERPDIRSNLLDAAEALIRDEGYAAATARRIADCVGMKHQAIFYYFGSQDELLIEVFRRSAKSNRAVLEAALNSPLPLSAMWDVIRDPQVTRFTLEFMALANHNEAVRKELAKNAVEIRNLEEEAIGRHLRERGIEPRISPRMVSIMTNSMARLLVQEAALGIHEGHEEALAMSKGGFEGFESTGETDLGNAPLLDAIGDKAGAPPK